MTADGSVKAGHDTGTAFMAKSKNDVVTKAYLDSKGVGFTPCVFTCRTDAGVGTLEPGEFFINDSGSIILHHAMADGTLWCIKREGSNFVQELSGIVTISELGGRTMFQATMSKLTTFGTPNNAIHCTLETSDRRQKTCLHGHQYLITILAFSRGLFSHDHHLPPKPWQEGATFTNDTTGVGYTYTGGKWLASGGPKVDGEYVRKVGGDEMMGPFKVTQNPDMGSREGRRIEALGLFSGSDSSALRLGTNGDRVYVGSNDTSFNGLVKLDQLQEKGSNGIKISSEAKVEVSSGVALSINNGSVKFWSSGAVELGSYTAFQGQRAGHQGLCRRGNRGHRHP